MDNNSEVVSTEEGNLSAAIIERHKKEKKAVQARIQALKKSATKGDKKKKKEIQEQIAALETEIEARHNSELQSCESNLEKVTIEMENCKVAEDINALRVSKAQRRRQKKELHEKERRKLIEEADQDYVHSRRYLETETIQKKLRERGLMVMDVPPDGDCMYNAVDYELQRSGSSPLGVSKLREKTAEYILQHSEDFFPFITDPNTGEFLNSEAFEKYCNGVRTSQWGSQLELQALSQVLRKSFTVVVGDGPDVVMGDEFQNGQLILTFHNHMYGLGAHYNAVQEWKEDEIALNDF